MLRLAADTEYASQLEGMSNNDWKLRECAQPAGHSGTPGLRDAMSHMSFRSRMPRGCPGGPIGQNGAACSNPPR